MSGRHAHTAKTASTKPQQATSKHETKANLLAAYKMTPASNKQATKGPGLAAVDHSQGDVRPVVEVDDAALLVHDGHGRDVATGVGVCSRSKEGGVLLQACERVCVCGGVLDQGQRRRDPGSTCAWVGARPID